MYRNVRTMPTVSAHWAPDFASFREASGPVLRAGYAGAFVYFSLQWAFFRDLTGGVGDRDTDRADAGEDREDHGDRGDRGDG